MSNSTELAPRAEYAPVVPGVMSDSEIQRTYRVAAALAASGIFKDVKSAEQAFGKLIVGRALGLNEAQSLSLYAFDGKIELPASMLAGFVRERPGYDYTVDEHTDDLCRITFMVDGEARGTSEFNRADAERAGLLGKDNWKKYPAAMFFARTMSQGVRWFVPEVLGGLPVYTEGEIERTPNLAEGTGAGTDPGWGDVPIAAVHEVELLIRRAEKLGHAGLASRSAAQMTLSGQTPDAIRAWINQAAGELANLQAKQQVERGEPVSIEPPEHPEEEGTPQPEGVNDDGSPITEADVAPQMKQGAEGDEPDVLDLPHETQVELAQARLEGARNEAEEREALAALAALRGKGTA